MRPLLVGYGNEGDCDWLIGLTERRAVGHQDVDAFRDEVPFIQQGLTPRQVEPPAVKPRSPVETEGGGDHINDAQETNRDYGKNIKSLSGSSRYYHIYTALLKPAVAAKVCFNAPE